MFLRQQGLGKLDRKVFRIGHLGDLNETTLIGALAAIEMALGIAEIPHRKGGVLRALDYLVSSSKEQQLGERALSAGHQA